MREILFRGKCKETGEWVYGCYVFDEYQDYIIEYGENIKYEIIKETVTQFIGLLDKNGKEIFEGDKVKIDFGEFYNRKINKILPKRKTLIVTFEKGSFCLRDLNNVWFGQAYGFKDHNIEVVGNIFEKGGKK